MNFIKTLTADKTTAEFACDSRGVTRSQMLVDEVWRASQQAADHLFGEKKKYTLDVRKNIFSFLCTPVYFIYFFHRIFYVPL